MWFVCWFGFWFFSGGCWGRGGFFSGGGGGGGSVESVAGADGWMGDLTSVGGCRMCGGNGCRAWCGGTWTWPGGLVAKNEVRNFVRNRNVARRMRFCVFGLRIRRCAAVWG